MSRSLFWVNKDSGSAVLSRSSRVEDQRIREHVQHERQVRRKSKSSYNAIFSKNGLPRKHNSRRGASSEQIHKVLGLKLDTSLVPRSPRDHRSVWPTISPTSSSTSPTSRLLQAVNSSPRLEPQEIHSLVFFCQRTAPEWSGWRDAAFWNVLVLRACQFNQSILHGVIALGAFHELSEIGEELGKVSHLYQLVIHQSSKATRMAYELKMSDIMSLISCIIFICLQNLQDSHTAYQLIKSGHSLITDLDSRLASGDVVLMDSEQTALNNFLRPIVERLRMRLCYRVDLPAALALNTAIQRNKTKHHLELVNIPSSFSNLQEARKILGNIVDWAQENIDVSQAYCEQRQHVHTLVLSWMAALENTVSAKSERYKALVASKKLLQAAAVAASIVFDTLGTTNECDYDRHVPRFAEIIELYKDAISHPLRSSRRASFGIDSGVIDTVVFVAGKCRDPVIRKTAIDLLARTNRREGDLQGCTAGSIMQTLVALEEEGLQVTEAGNVPETQRLRIWEYNQHRKTGDIEIFFVKWPYDPSLGAEVQTAHVNPPLERSRPVIEKAAPGSPISLPDVRYGQGFAAFLEEATQTYHRITMSTLFIPMPRL